MATAPVEVTVFISLRGGDELEEYYCPEIVCDWDDGAKSVQAPDCPPFEAGTPLTRHFTLGHLYRQGGYYAVRVQLRRGDRTIASGDATVRIQSGMSESR
jgi:hypothetical protein